jgi:hypothetical protein
LKIVQRFLSGGHVFLERLSLPLQVRGYRIVERIGGRLAVLNGEFL